MHDESTVDPVIRIAVAHYKIGALRPLIDHTAEAVKRKLPKIYSRELIDTLFGPCLTTAGQLFRKKGYTVSHRGEVSGDAGCKATDTR